MDDNIKPRNATLSLIVDINEVRDHGEMHVDLRATARECAELAKVLKVLEVKDFNAFVTLRKGLRPDLFEVEGHFTTHLVQECSVTLNPLDATVDDSFSEILTTSREALLKDADDDADDLDIDAPVELIEGGKIDVGAILSQWLALALDPYPRSDTPLYEHIEAANQNNSPDKYKPFDILGTIKEK